MAGCLVLGLKHAMNAQLKEFGWMPSCLYADFKSKVFPSTTLPRDLSNMARVNDATASVECGLGASEVCTVEFTPDLLKSSTSLTLLGCFKPKRLLRTLPCPKVSKFTGPLNHPASRSSSVFANTVSSSSGSPEDRTECKMARFEDLA